MTRHRAVLDGGRAIANRDGVDDVPGRVDRRAFGSPIRAALAQVRHQRFLEHAAALDEQTDVDRFV